MHRVIIVLTNGPMFLSSTALTVHVNTVNYTGTSKYLLPEILLSTNLLRSLPKAMDWSYTLYSEDEYKLHYYESKITGVHAVYQYYTYTNIHTCKSHSPAWSHIGQSNGWLTSKNSITPSLLQIIYF